MTVGGFGILHLVHREREAMQMVAVKSLAGTPRLFGRCHCDKSMVVRSSRFAVPDQGGFADGSRSGEKKLKVASPGLAGEIAHVEFVGHAMCSFRDKVFVAVSDRRISNRHSQHAVLFPLRAQLAIYQNLKG